MAYWLRRLQSRFGKAGRASSRGITDDSMTISERTEATDAVGLGADLATNLRNIKEIVGGNFDIGFREILISRDRIKAAIVYLDSLVDPNVVERILDRLTMGTFAIEREGGEIKPFDTALRSILIPEKGFRHVDSFPAFWEDVSMGDTGLLIDGFEGALVIESKGWYSRAVEESSSEPVIRGPRDGFVESLAVNVSLVRRRIRSPHLRAEKLTIGRLTQTDVVYMYIKGLAREGLVEEVRSRLERIDTDSILGSGYLEDFIEDTPFTLFPLVLNTQRPDRVAADMLEGKVAILVENTPEVIVVPATLNAMLQAPDDYYERATFGSFIRLIRIVAYIGAIILPGTYVAIVNFHIELLPTALLLRISASREGIPFPVVAEILMMEFLFEILREAGVRLPRAIGSAVSIVGALILGDAAISAGLVSPAVVIIVALTAISSFSAPTYSAAIAARLLRFGFAVLASILGLFGLQFGLLVAITHLAGLRSFGEPFLAPIAPLVTDELKDSIVRVPWWAMIYRPGGREPKRQDMGQKPRPPKSEEPSD
ncbi:MAG: spore germination protein [Firmicutes bacterium]|nr:spore germination protein [Bacillota bacterium]